MAKGDKGEKAREALLRTRQREEFVPREMLSTGSTLLNLACSGKVNGGFAKGKYYLVVGDSESGKAQPLDAKVLTTTGWVRMGDLQVGTLVVDPDGGVAPVVGVFPQGRKEVYRITFSDGSTTECCDEHLWLTQYTSERARGKSSVKTMQRLRADMVKPVSCRPANYIPMTVPVEFESTTDLPLPPYLLGALLGNGCFRSKGGPQFSSTDKETVDRVRSLLPHGHTMTHNSRGDYQLVYSKGRSNLITEALCKLGLHGRKSVDKLIPPEYLRASVKDRVELLHGLMDTDGTVSRSSSVMFATSSRSLAEGFLDLVWSLGARASMSVKKSPKYRYKGEVRCGHDSYQICFMLPAHIKPFSLTRKLDSYRPAHVKTPCRRVKSIEPSGVKECQCIAVGSKRHLYVTDDYIVTHNTWFSMSCFAEACLNPTYGDYDLVFDDPEDGALMDKVRYFGAKTEARVRPPRGTPTVPQHSHTVEDFYDNLSRLFTKGDPFIYVLDSMDALKPAAEVKKLKANTKARETGKEEKGDYGTAKPKLNSQNLGWVIPELARTRSVLVIVSQTRHNIGFNAMFQPKTRGGGDALRFYATCELWTSVVKKLKKKVNDTNHEVGMVSRVAVKKNRQTGKHAKVDIQFLHNYGIDDVGSMIEYLCQEGRWKGKERTVEAPDFDFTGRKDTLAKMIENEGLVPQLKDLVGDTWDEIERACTPDRKPRYE